MAAYEYTETDLSNLRKSIREGASRTKIDGREVEFRSLEDMQKLEASIARSLGRTSSTRTTRQINLRPRSGW